ncbi:MAG: hypothetical protein WCF95_00230 [bacterium]
MIDAVIKNKDYLPYVNLDDNNDYKGWVDNFNLKNSNNEQMRLDLSKEEDLFLLFVLASAWSKTGPWENAAYFTAYLKFANKSDIELWLNQDFIGEEICQKEYNAHSIIKEYTGIESRKKVSFRKDFYLSVGVIARQWHEIKEKLLESNQKSDYIIFIDYIRQIKGLGTKDKSMRIKIPLILRELRCQKIYPNIEGAYCCVPDERVKSSAKELGIKLPNDFLKASKVIYENFGDLYDIPLFAYNEKCIKEDMGITSPCGK